MMLHHNKRFILLSLLFAAFYNAWILGYLLNPAVISTQPISGLAAVGQPWRWLFMATDIIASLFVVCIALDSRKKAYRISLIAFSLFTILAAIFTESRAAGTGDFSALPDIVHLIFSCLSLISLMAAVIIGYRLVRRRLLASIALSYILTTCLLAFIPEVPVWVGLWGQKVNSILTGIWLILQTYEFMKKN